MWPIVVLPPPELIEVLGEDGCTDLYDVLDQYAELKWDLRHGVEHSPVITIGAALSKVLGDKASDALIQLCNQVFEVEAIRAGADHEATEQV